MTEALQVYYRHHCVGTIQKQTANQFDFIYDEAWLESHVRFPISLRLPLRASSFGHDAASAFFGNLLPEGTIRQMVARRFGVSPDNDFGLLKAIGGECAGALSIVSTAPDVSATEQEQPITTEEFNTFIREHNAFPSVVGDSALRLSLAGAQDKLPVRAHDDGLFLPRGGSASTHILKFPNSHYKHLPANEVFVMQFAQRLGLPAANADLLTHLATIPLCLVERYDRHPNVDGFVERLHQEDFCQALGHGAGEKYESEGGPSLTDCFGLIDTYGDEPLLDSRALLNWHVFNCVIGNADGHAKNLSLVFANGIRLAPFYDLVCTHAYQKLNKEMAMATGDKANPLKLTASHWHHLAGTIGLQPQYVLNQAATLATKASETLGTHADEFQDTYGPQPAVQMIIPKIKKLIRVLLRATT